jgi:hypothetical protein
LKRFCKFYAANFSELIWLYAAGRLIRTLSYYNAIMKALPDLADLLVDAVKPYQENTGDADTKKIASTLTIQPIDLNPGLMRVPLPAGNQHHTPQTQAVTFRSQCKS